MRIVSVLVLAPLLVMTLTALLNAFFWRRLGTTAAASRQPRVSVLIPARNEAAHIGETVRALRQQTYANMELLLLDDQSDDGTATAAAAAAAGDARFQVLRGRPLPAQWLGKNWACHQLAQAADGEILIFTDADVRWEPDGVAAVVAEMVATQADLLSVWPTQQTETWGERLVVPLMALAVLAYLPLPLTHHTPWPIFAAANGQCLAFRHAAYAQIGGHEAVRGSVLEDVTLARRVKGVGGRLRLADGAGLVRCRMYAGWADARRGFGKNILAGYGNSVLLLLLATIFHWAVFLLPWVWLLLGWRMNFPGWPAWPALLVGLGLLTRALTAWLTGQRPRDALLMPLSVLLMTVVAGQALWWRHQGGPRWKGRVVTDG